MRPATPEEIARWDELVAANPDGGAVLQLKAFAETKARHGWRSKYVMFGEVAVSVIARRIPLLGELWYVPNGPGVANLAGLEAFAKAARELESPPFLIKLDPELLAQTAPADQLEKLGFKPTRSLQYNTNTVIVDLEPDEETILAGFRQKTRYNIRLAAKKGVTVEAVPTNPGTIDTMYHLYGTTTHRAGVYLRSKSYFTDYWQRYSESGHGQLFFASYEGQVLAGAFIFYLGKKALYKDGGSIREHTAVQAPYALQWEIMRWLKGRGVTKYDMHGTPPPDRIDDPKHPMAGLARFKTGFQPEVTTFMGTWDLPLSSVAYTRWQKYGERLVVAFEFRVRRRLFY